MSRQTVEFAITAAERLNEILNAFLQIDREGALRRAEEIERDGNAGPLAGIPIAVKDNICVKGLQASCGSKILGDYHPPYNATVIERLTKAGGIIIGLTARDARGLRLMRSGQALEIVVDTAGESTEETDVLELIRACEERGIVVSAAGAGGPNATAELWRRLGQEGAPSDRTLTDHGAWNLLEPGTKVDLGLAAVHLLQRDPDAVIAHSIEEGARELRVGELQPDRGGVGQRLQVLTVRARHAENHAPHRRRAVLAVLEQRGTVVKIRLSSGRIERGDAAGGLSV